MNSSNCIISRPHIYSPTLILRLPSDLSCSLEHAAGAAPELQMVDASNHVATELHLKHKSSISTVTPRVARKSCLLFDMHLFGTCQGKSTEYCPSAKPQYTLTEQLAGRI